MMKLHDEIKSLEDQIHKLDADVNINKIKEYTTRQKLLEDEVVILAEKIMPLNDQISEEPEHHPVTFMKVVETDFTNPDDVLKNL